VSGVTDDGMREKMDEYLKNELKVSGFKVEERAWVGEVVHIFSHIKQTLRVEYMAVSGDIKSENAPKKIDSDDDFISEEEEEDKKKKKKKTKKGKEVEAKMRWVEAEEFHKSAVSKQMRKCFEAFEKFKENGGKIEVASKKPKKKEAKVDTNQKSISSFFGAAKKK